MNEWSEHPEEDGWYFLRWSWWPQEDTECVCVYTNEDIGKKYVARLDTFDQSIDDLQPEGSRWMKIELPDTGPLSFPPIEEQSRETQGEANE